MRSRQFLFLGLIMAIAFSLTMQRGTQPVPLDAAPAVHAVMGLGTPAAMDVDSSTSEAPQPVAARTRFTFHMYVDPIYGDDIRAAAQNPKNTGSAGVPLSTHAWTQGPPGYLQHAPYSFQTVTAALAWIKPLNGPNTLPLPWKHPTQNRWIDYIVIHCLPGLYGPVLIGPPAIIEIDSRSGLPWNNETFPLVLPPRVSIQGASALDTIFDARKQTVNIFEIGVQVISEPSYDWIHTFIDSITLRGARDLSPSTGQNGAGVRIWGEPSVEATISNCFFTNNLVGVGMWVDDPDSIHYPRIVNNTFAWNQVGVYNGSNVAAHQGTGQNMPMLFNNIFDVSTPTPYQALGYLAGISAFEGIDSSDRTVQSIPNGNPMLDFNAYEVPPAGQGVPRQNIGDIGATPYAWPQTQSRNTGQTYTPRVNLFNYTQTPTTYGAYSTQRGALYINDIFRMDASIPMIAIHDFRLAPTVIRGDNQARSVNPLIGQGLDLGYANGVPVYVGLITMVNGTASPYAPGLPPGAEDLVVINCWDFDADGFGNPRVSDRRYGPQPGQWGRVDIGADESAEVTISGYIESTRIFSRPHSGVAPNTAGLVGGSSVYFFNVYHGVGQANNTYWRYGSNFPVDLVYTTPHQRPTGTEWYNQIINNPYGTGNNYTNGGFDNRVLGGSVTRSERHEWNVGGTHNKPDFMRNLFCDIAPHLHYDFRPIFKLGTTIPDPLKTYPHWGEYIRFVPPPAWLPYPLYDDIFHSNPWFEGTALQNQSKYDNGQLFYDPNTQNTWPRTSIVKPPLTVPQFTWATGDKSYLLSNQNHAIWLFEWPNTPPLTWIYTVNSYGWGGPDSPPFQYPWHGVRFNCQLLDPNNSYWPPLRVTNNLQTFLVVEGLPNPELGLSSSKSSGSKASQITSYSHPDRDIYPGSKIYKPLMKAFRDFLRKKLSGK